MEDSRARQKLHLLLQGAAYGMITLEIAILFYSGAPWWGHGTFLLEKLAKLPIYRSVFYSKLFILLLLTLAGMGSLWRKNPDLDPKTRIALPLFSGLLLFFGSTLFFFFNRPPFFFSFVTWFEAGYILSSFTGAVLVHIGMANISCLVKARIGTDRWNVENESFEQPLRRIDTPYSINLPLQFYFKGRVRRGWVNILNPFRGSLVIGTPGSGKSFSVVHPFIRQLLAKGFSMLVYDYKFPDLAEIAYLHYLWGKKGGALKDYRFHVINLGELEKSRRVNPLKADYITSLADAAETAESLVEALRKGEKGGGNDQFFHQSAINFLASVIFFLSRYKGGRFSSLAHVLAFVNRPYEDIFAVLFSEPELQSLLSPFQSAFQNRAFDQLEGQVGTLKINISRLATKETFWVFSGDDVDLRISNPEHPSVLVLANDPNNQNINSACYSVVLNRLARLVNSRGNLPCALVLDEVPTLYLHRVENLMATARSNRVAVLMGLQELPQFRLQYGKEAAQTIVSVVGNILSGSARDRETLDWLEKLFGKSKQVSAGLSIDRSKTSLNRSERMDPLIPGSKIAHLRSGELVGLIAQEADDSFNGRFCTSAFNGRININMEEIKRERAHYRTTPIFYNFGTDEQKSRLLTENFLRITREIGQIIYHCKQTTNTH
ncbi:type IV secretory system conjugative DNA transfer family protein [Paraflavisolibacter sp. H34]|uniref:type IV secretory system conjugative DNA transfer family protein n=1 Tax=Huijunlia imazamoxiresistens TaxID=3127457 RepID=UPI003016E0D8